MFPARCSSSAPRRAARAALTGAAVALVVLSTGCRVDADLSIEANGDGSGEVTATVTLDDAAAAETGPLAENVAVDDLRDAGWKVRTTERAITATKRFAHPDDARAVLDELGGPLVTSARVERKQTFAKTTTVLDVELDLTSGVSGFSDADLNARLGGLPPGLEPDDLEVTLRAKAPDEADVTTEVAVGEKAAVSAAGTDWHVLRVLAAFAAPSFLAAAALIVLRSRSVPVPVTEDP